MSLHDFLMDAAGWPAIAHDGSLLVSHQDVLLMGGKVQAPAGYADHVRFQDLEVCGRCGNKLCVEMCSGQAITRSLEGPPNFDREKCVFCGACMWNCPESVDGETQPAISRRRGRTALGGKLEQLQAFVGPKRRFARIVLHRFSATHDRSI